MVLRLKTVAQLHGSRKQLNYSKVAPCTNPSLLWYERPHTIFQRQLADLVLHLQIAVDACCVLAELVYTLLSQDCSPGWPENPAWLELLSHISLVITALFLVEIPFASWTFGLSYYNPFRGVPFASLHLLDALIIVTTFTLEAILKGRERELAGLLVVFRLWRIVKLVGGPFIKQFLMPPLLIAYGRGCSWCRRVK
jgi:hypothetical protein